LSFEGASEKKKRCHQVNEFMVRLIQCDEQLIEQFEAGTLPLECFHHRDHVHMAFLYLSKWPVIEALARFCSALKGFAAVHGKDQLYHETITWAYIFLINERIARAGRRQTWEEFEHTNGDLLTWKSGVLHRYYREETLSSPLARSVFILPVGQDPR
jgi:hypothetical protein